MAKQPLKRLQFVNSFLNNSELGQSLNVRTEQVIVYNYMKMLSWNTKQAGTCFAGAQF